MMQPTLTIPINELRRNASEKRSLDKPSTSYCASLIHFVKGNAGIGLLAMGDAYKNGGMIFTSFSIVFVGIISLYCEYTLVRCTYHRNNQTKLTYPQAIELAFTEGPQGFHKYSGFAEKSTRVFIAITQLGFCSTYVLFIASTLSTVVYHYTKVDIMLQIYIMMIYFPILILCLVNNLKYMTPISLISNFFLCVALIFILYKSFENDLPSPAGRKDFGSWNTIPLSISTVIFSYEGIALVLPLVNEMKKPEQFTSVVGVLNIGLFIITVVFIVMGSVTYMKYGEDVRGSISLNLPPGEIISNFMKGAMAIAILLSFPLQFYIAAEMVLIEFMTRFPNSNNMIIWENAIKVLLVSASFICALVIPNIGLLISLIGAVGCTALSLIFPPLCDIATRLSRKNELQIHFHNYLIDIGILVFGVIATIVGTYTSLTEIIAHIQTKGFN